jgi:hypothetical protein
MDRERAALVRKVRVEDEANVYIDTVIEKVTGLRNDAIISDEVYENLIFLLTDKQISKATSMMRSILLYDFDANLKTIVSAKISKEGGSARLIRAFSPYKDGRTYVIKNWWKGYDVLLLELMILFVENLVRVILTFNDVIRNELVVYFMAKQYVKIRGHRLHNLPDKTDRDKVMEMFKLYISLNDVKFLQLQELNKLNQFAKSFIKKAEKAEQERVAAEQERVAAEQEQERVAAKQEQEQEQEQEQARLAAEQEQARLAAQPVKQEPLKQVYNGATVLHSQTVVPSGDDMVDQTDNTVSALMKGLRWGSALRQKRGKKKRVKKASDTPPTSTQPTSTLIDCATEYKTINPDISIDEVWDKCTTLIAQEKKDDHLNDFKKKKDDLLNDFMKLDKYNHLRSKYPFYK